VLHFSIQCRDTEKSYKIIAMSSEKPSLTFSNIDSVKTSWEGFGEIWSKFII